MEHRYMQIKRAIVLKRQKMLAPILLDVVQCMLLIIKFVGEFHDLEVNHEIGTQRK